MILTNALSDDRQVQREEIVALWAAMHERRLCTRERREALNLQIRALADAQNLQNDPDVFRREALKLYRLLDSITEGTGLMPEDYMRDRYIGGAKINDTPLDCAAADTKPTNSLKPLSDLTETVPEFFPLDTHLLEDADSAPPGDQDGRGEASPAE